MKLIFGILKKKKKREREWIRSLCGPGVKSKSSIHNISALVFKKQSKGKNEDIYICMNVFLNTKEYKWTQVSSGV